MNIYYITYDPFLNCNVLMRTLAEYKSIESFYHGNKDSRYKLVPEACIKRLGLSARLNKYDAKIRLSDLKLSTKDIIK
jgi:hypothetical protein